MDVSLVSNLAALKTQAFLNRCTESLAQNLDQSYPDASKPCGIAHTHALRKLQHEAKMAVLAAERRLGTALYDEALSDAIAALMELADIAAQGGPDSAGCAESLLG